MSQIKRVLLVEDTERHRREGTEALRAAGYDVIIAHNFSEALYNPVGLRGNSYDAIVTDMFMPHSEEFPALVPAGLGVILAAAARNIPVVVVSDKHHHMEDMEWIHALQCGQEPEIDVPFAEGLLDADGKWLRDQEGAVAAGLGSKNWEQVLSYLERLLPV